MSASLTILAFVMMNVKVGTDRDVVSRLRTLKGVREVYEVYAVYDIVAIVEAPTMGELERACEFGDPEDRDHHKHEHDHR